MTETPNFINSFWGPSKEAGFRVIQTRIHHGLETLKELKDFYEERNDIEHEYSKRLEKLALKTTLGSHETGLLKCALDKLSVEAHEAVNISNKFQQAVSSSNYDKLNTFYGIYKKKVLKIEHHMTKLMTRRAEFHKQYEHAKFKYRDDCGLIKLYRLQTQASWGGKEVDRIEAKLHKLEMALPSTRSKYEKAVQQLQEIEQCFVTDWSTVLRDFYLLEAERIQVCKVNCFTYCNNLASACVNYDQLAEKARAVIATINAQDDLQSYAQTYATGNHINTAPEYIEFMEGLEEKPEGLQYLIADFEVPAFLARSQSMYSMKRSPTREAASTDHIYLTSPPKSNHMNSPTKSSHTTSPPKSMSSRRKTMDSVEPFVQETHNKLPQRKKPVDFPETPLRANDNVPLTSTPGSATMLGKVTLPPPSSMLETPSYVRNDNIRVKPASNYSSAESDDVFSDGHLGNQKQFRDSGGSNSSQPSRYTTSSVYLTTSSNRNWATPRRKEELQRARMQEKINRSLKELPQFPEQSTMAFENDDHGLTFGKPLRPAVPIQKDFSIDYIAKALEDLNSGGDGDVNGFRRSVKKEREIGESRTANTTPYTHRETKSVDFKKPQARKSAPQLFFEPEDDDSSSSRVTTQKQPNFHPKLAVDMIDDHDEVATRYGSGSFSISSQVQETAHSRYTPRTTKSRPKSMYEATPQSKLDPRRPLSTYEDRKLEISTPQWQQSSSKPRRSLLKTPSKSYTNLYSFIQDSPLKPPKSDNGITPGGQRYESQVRTMYTYKAQHHGELSFKKGCLMYVLNKQEDNWYLCEVAAHEPDAGTMGLVPGNYVREEVF